MPFQIGNKYGGKQVGAGRKRKNISDAKKTALQLVREIIEGNAVKLGRRYTRRALGKNGDRVLIHAIDKLYPTNDRQPSGFLGNTYIQFKFGSETDPRLSQERQPGDIDSGEIRLVGDEGGSR